MTKIEFKIDGQVITKKNDKTVVEKSRNEYMAVFDFDDTWTDVENKQAYFTRYKDGLCVKADIDETGSCKVPWEVIEMPMFYVSVAGGDLKTVTRASVFVEQTGYSEDAEKSGTVPEVIRTPQSLLFKDNTLSMLDRNGETVGNGVTLPSGGTWRKIVDITVSAEQAGANVLESYLDITKEDLAKINRLMFFCKLPCDGSYAVGNVKIQANIKPSVDGTYYQILCYNGNNFQAAASGRVLYAMSTADLAYDVEIVRSHDASIYANLLSENTASRETIYSIRRERLTANSYTPHLYVNTTNMPIVENAVVQLYVM